MEATKSGLARWIPILGWLPGYRRSWLTSDVVAGLTVWALIVPESMAYAGVAGVPVQYGLYAVPLAVVAYAILGTSRQLFVGPSSTVAALSAATVAPLVASSGANPVALTAVVALVVGVLYIALGLLRMGWVARFFAKPVLDGFIVGLGLFIAVGQLPKLVGVSKSGGNTLHQFLSVIGDIGSWSWVTVAVGAAGLAVLFILGRFVPKAPAALIVAAVSIIVAKAFNLSDHGVAIVGPVPTGFHFVPWTGISGSTVVDMVPGALGIVIVGFAQSVAIAKAYASKYQYKIDANQELLAYGAASIGAGVLQGYTVTGSLSKSAAADDAGAKTPLLLGIVSLMVLLTILFIAGVFEYLPEATLAAIVIYAVSGMIDFSKLKRLWDARVVDFWLAVAALAGVVLINILPGIVIGVGLSLVLFIHRLDHPHTAVLGRNADGSEYADLAEHPEFAAVPGLIMFRFDAPLIFANADEFADGLEDVVSAAADPPTAVVLDLEATYEIDTTGADALLQVKQTLDDRGIRLVIARPRASVRDFLDRTGTTGKIGSENVCATVDEAVASATRRAADSG